MQKLVQQIRKAMSPAVRWMTVPLLWALVTHVSYAQCSLDIHIANDQSGSIDAVENTQGKQFIRKLAQSIELGTGSTGNRIAVSNWASSNTWVQYTFPAAGKNYTTNVSDVVAYANSPQTIFGNTDPYQALQKSYAVINQNPIAGRTSPKVIVLMTDAYCSQVQAGISSLANQIKASGIYVMVLALDDATTCSKLQGTNVASPGMYFAGGSYADLQNQAVSKIQSLIASLCTNTNPKWDLKIDLTAANCPTGAAGYTVSNTGTAAFSGAVHVSFYDGNPTLPTTHLLASTSHAGQSIAPGASVNLTYTNTALANKSKLYAVVNIAAANASPPLAYNIGNALAVAGEGGTTNNMSTVFSATGCPVAAPVLQVSSVSSGVDCYRRATYQVQVCNVGTADAHDVTIDNYSHNPEATLLSVTSSGVGGSSTIPFVGPITFNIPPGDVSSSGYDGYSTSAVNTVLDNPSPNSSYIVKTNTNDRVGYNYPLGGSPIPKNAIITSAVLKYAMGAYTQVGNGIATVRGTYRTSNIPFDNSANSIWSAYENYKTTQTDNLGTAVPQWQTDVKSAVQSMVNEAAWSPGGNLVFTVGNGPGTLSNGTNNNFIAVFQDEIYKKPSLAISYQLPGLTIPAGECITLTYVYDMAGGDWGATFQNSVGVNTSSPNATILPNNSAFSVNGVTGVRGYNGATNTGDEIYVPAANQGCSTGSAPLTTIVEIIPTEVCGAGAGVVTAKVTINNPNTVPSPGATIYNTLEKFNLAGGATFAGEPYNVSPNLQLAQANVLDPAYPLVPNALFGKTGAQSLQIYQIPPGTSEFYIDITSGSTAFNLSSTVTNIPSQYNASGSSNTASDATGVSIAPTPDVFITSGNCGNAIPASTTMVALAGTASNASASSWTSSTNGSIVNTGTATAPAATYTITDQDRANGYINITLRGVSAAGCDNSATCRITLTGSKYDFGDAPTSYDYSQATIPGVAGALITAANNIYLGATAPDAETSPIWSNPANGDDNNGSDDEDGIASFPTITAGTTSYAVNFTATNGSGAPATAIAWIDWDNDGFFDPKEASTPVTIPAGTSNGSFTANWSGIVTTAGDKYVRIRIASNLTIYDYVGTTKDGEVEDYLTAPKPTANDDSSTGNTPGNPTTINILTNDTLGDGSPATPSNTTVALTTTGLPTGSTVSTDGLTVTVPGEGTWTYNPTTGELTFDPQTGFSGNPTDITYILTETATGQSDPAVVDITYVQNPPVANDDSSTGNTLGSNAVVNILTNDVLADGSTATPGNTSVALTTTGLPTGSTVSADGLTLTVPGQGVWTYNPANGELTFDPEAGYNGNPTPVNYILTETSTGLSDPAVVTVTYNGALPVKLVRFSAVKENSTALLSWSTTEELNSEYFEVQRSQNGREWNIIGQVAAKGESTALTNYHFVDAAPLAEENLYRLKMVDHDGTFAHSRIVLVNFESSNAITAYPNPASNLLRIGFADGVKPTEGVREIVIVNMVGVEVFRQKATKGKTIHEIDVKGLSAGTYLLTITLSEGSKQTRKIVIAK